MLPSSKAAYLPTMRCVIVVPTYNEAATIGDLLEAIDAIRTEIAPVSIDVLVGDDNSPDGTRAVVSGHPGFGDWVRILPRASKDGLVAAYRAGFAAAVQDGYDVVVQMDADGSHPASAIPFLLGLLDTNDVAIGSRYVPGGRTENWPARRRVLSAAANTYARSVLRLRTRDCTSGFRAWRAAAIATSGIVATTSTGYGFQVENTRRCERRGLQLAEAPITFTERCAGTSKMSTGVAREAALLVLRWRVREMTNALATATPWNARHEGAGRS
jgi:dolichol-phosphate mannosyltransferase